MNMKRTILVLAAALMVPTTAYGASWERNATGYYYLYDDGSYPADGIYEINGVRYAFNERGYMATGWQFSSGKWYYFNPTHGGQECGWVKVSGKWYYMDASNGGAMHTGWLDVGGQRYYLDESGAMKTGIFSVMNREDGVSYAYQADGSGALIRNTEKESGDSIIRYDENGVMMYRNNLTKMVNKIDGGDTWQYVLDERDMETQREENKGVVDSAAREIEDELFDSYALKVAIESSSSKKTSALASWEKKVRKSLEKYRSEEEIESYIATVKRDEYERYDDSPRTYTDSEFTYTLIFDNDDDYYQVLIEKSGYRKTYTFGKKYDNWYDDDWY